MMPEMWNKFKLAGMYVGTIALTVAAVIDENWLIGAAAVFCSMMTRDVQLLLKNKRNANH